MTRDEFVEAVRREGAAFSAAAGRDLSAPVPSCPDWDVRALVAHLGRVHRWVTGILREGATERPPFPPAPDPVDLAWFEEGLAGLLAALSETDPDAVAWNFSSAPDVARFWSRRQACETAVHRWDAERAVGPSAGPIETELALTGADEVLDLFLAGRKADLGGTLRFAATDSVHGDWLARVDPEDGLVVGHGHGEGGGADATLRATASDLYLWLWQRPVPEGRFEVLGDAAVVERWRQQLKVG